MMSLNEISPSDPAQNMFIMFTNTHLFGLPHHSWKAYSNVNIAMKSEVTVIK